MKEDILEQMVEDWFVAQKGWFVKHNIRYRPSKGHPDYRSKLDSVHSDIDILALSNILRGKQKVAAVTCKSWQGGFRAKEWITTFEKEAIYNEKNVKFQKREKWKYFREIISDKWIDAFLKKIVDETGQKSFTYYIAVTHFVGTDKDRKQIEKLRIVKERFKKRGSNINIRILTLEEMITDYLARLNSKSTPSLEATDVGRLLQLLRAAKMHIQLPNV